MKKILNLLLLLSLGFNIGAQDEVLQGKLLDRWTDDALPSSSVHDNRYNEVWGVVQDDREYAIIGTTYGTHFIDVTDPENIEEVVRVIGGTAGSEVIHRDYHDHMGYLYAVCDEGSQSTLQIIDYSTLPDSVSVVYDSKQFIRRAHNIFIDQDNDKLYAMYTAGQSLNFAPLRIFDISNPIEPKVIRDYFEIGGFSLIPGVHDGYFKDNLGYLNNGFGGMGIFDFTKADSATLIAFLSASEYPQPGYNHSGWPSEDGKYYYMADEDHGHAMKTINLVNLPDISVEGIFDADSPSEFSIPHNQVVSGNYLYVSYYFDGLQVYDISTPETPIRKMFYPTSSREHQNGRYQGAWGVYPFLPSGNILVSDMQEGLFVIENIELLSDIDDTDISDDFTIIPNPSDGNIALNQIYDHIELVDLSGRTIQVWQNQNEVIVNEKVLNGIYILKADNASTKLVINR